MAVLRPELRSTCLLNLSFHPAALLLAGALPLLLSEGKGEDLTLKLWLHQPHGLSRFKGLS